MLSAATKPNILLIMSDDMGFSDIGCYGSEVQTPNLDSLAQNGIRFTQFYNMARCCPTRASLLTGLYPHQTGVGHMMEERGANGYRGKLNRNCVTLAEVLRSAGYPEPVAHLLTGLTTHASPVSAVSTSKPSSLSTPLTDDRTPGSSSTTRIEAIRQATR